MCVQHKRHTNMQQKATCCQPGMLLCCASCRGKGGKLQGNLAGVMAVLKGTPTTYNKDFQECWELMFDSVDALHDCIRIATGVLSTIKINPDRMMKVRDRFGRGHFPAGNSGGMMTFTQRVLPPGKLACQCWHPWLT